MSSPPLRDLREPSKRYTVTSDTTASEVSHRGHAGGAGTGGSPLYTGGGGAAGVQQYSPSGSITSTAAAGAGGRTLSPAPSATGAAAQPQSPTGALAGPHDSILSVSPLRHSPSKGAMQQVLASAAAAVGVAQGLGSPRAMSSGGLPSFGGAAVPGVIQGAAAAAVLAHSPSSKSLGARVAAPPSPNTTPYHSIANVALPPVVGAQGGGSTASSDTPQMSGFSQGFSQGFSGGAGTPPILGSVGSDGMGGLFYPLPSSTNASSVMEHARGGGVGDAGGMRVQSPLGKAGSDQSVRLAEHLAGLNEALAALATSDAPH